MYNTDTRISVPYVFELGIERAIADRAKHPLSVVYTLIIALFSIIFRRNSSSVQRIVHVRVHH